MGKFLYDPGDVVLTSVFDILKGILWQPIGDFIEIKMLYYFI